MLLKLLWVLVSFLIGALPFSVWIGRMAGQEIRDYGDGNPGATNVLRAAGWPWFFLALMSDISKAAAPVGLAYYIFGWQEWWIVPIALAPSLGHAFSPFLGGRGGKALATMLGSWIGLTLWVMSGVALLALTIFFGLIKGEIWAVLATIGVMFLFLFFVLPPNPYFIAVQVGQLLLVLWTHRQGISSRPRLRLLANNS